MKILAISIAVVVAIALLIVLTSGIWWPAYVKYTHPMGKLDAKIDIGDSFDETWSMIERYCENRSSADDVDCSRGLTSDLPTTYQDRFCQDGTISVQYVHVYDFHIMDDLQLWVYFDDDSQVCNKLFYGD